MAKRGMRARRRAAAAGRLEQPPPKQLANPYPPFEIASADQIEAIHHASLRVLSEHGINFLLEEARDVLKAAGAEVEPDGPRVRFDPDFVMEMMAKVPSSFTLHARNPDKAIQIGANWINFSTVSSAPNASDLDRGRRTGTFEDYCNFLRLAQSFNIIHFIGGYPVEPVDLPVPTRHLDAIAAIARLTDHNLYGYALGRERMEDAIEMARIARGIDAETLLREPSINTVVNANSPLQYDRPMLAGAMAMARAGQPVVYTPFTLAGAMAPVTIPGALVQQNAEALAGLVFSQAVNPGVPAVYGSFTSNVDMKSGAPAFGTPEYVKATLISGQLCRRYKVPFRASNANASNAPDGQAVYESAMSVWACILGHCNMMKHGAGWLEGGLCASFEKFILDVEQLQMMAAFMEPLDMSEEELAVEAIKSVGPGSHYFQSSHTMERYETAFYHPLLSDWRNFETWTEDGAVDATHRANRIWKQVLAEYQTPALDPAVDEELTAFVERRREEGGAPPL